MKKVNTSIGELYIGAAPLIKNLFAWNSGHRFDVIWNLAYELYDLVPLEEYYSNKVLFAGIKDYSIPEHSFKEQLFSILNALSNNEKVFIHCYGGVGRTGMALAIIKHYLDKLSIEDSLKFSKENCNGPETYQQINFVKMFCENELNTFNKI